MKLLIWTTLVMLQTASSLSSTKSVSCCRRSSSVLDCTTCNLTSLPLSLMDNQITELLLADNNISSIPNGSFKDFINLRRLILTNNPLQGLNKETFRGLDFLKDLEIGSTYLSPHPLAASAFWHLKHLRRLVLYYVYPIELPRGCLRPLRSLETLGISMASRTSLGSEFLDLKTLKKLHIAKLYRPYGRTRLDHFANETLAAISQIEELQIIDCVHAMASDALINMTKVSTLIIVCNQYLPLNSILDAIKNMPVASLRRLVLDGNDGGQPKALMESDFNSSSFTNITHLSLRNTGIVDLDWKIFYRLPKLLYVNIGLNSIIRYEPYHHLDVFLEMLHLTQLKYIDLSYMFNVITGPDFLRWYCPYPANFQTFIGRLPQFNTSCTRPKTDFKYNKTKYHGLNDNAQILLNIPPTLNYIILSHISFIMDLSLWPLSLNINPENNILHVDLSFSKMKEFPTLIIGLGRLEALDFSHCGLNVINVHLLHHLPNIRFANFSHNNLRMMNISTFLAGGSSLEWLDISYNNFNNIGQDALSNLSSIKYICLRGNPLVNAMFNLQQNTKLQTLDLSNTALVNLTKEFLNQLDHLQSQLNHTLTGNFSDNKFICSCTTIYMIKWFQSTKMKIINKENITCKLHNMTVPIVTIKTDKLMIDCSRQPTRIALVISLPLLFILCFSFALISAYQFRWHLRWYVYKARWRIRQGLGRHKDELILENECHAFVSYNHSEDYEWIKNELVPVVEDEWGLNLCIGERDFLVGKPITENVIEAIERSLKTILVVTPAFASSEWCEFEMQMALIKRRANLVIIYKEEVMVGDMSKTLRDLMRILNYIKYNHDPNGKKIFWRRLKESLTEHEYE